jgi:hypothetical protein
MTIGSIYGEGIYSADLYSWEVAWGYEDCEETLVERQPYQLPPVAVWPGQSCQPLTVRETFRPPPVAVWSSSACDPLTVRRPGSTPPPPPSEGIVGFRFGNFHYGRHEYSNAVVRVSWPSNMARRDTAIIATRGLPSGRGRNVTARPQPSSSQG